MKPKVLALASVLIRLGWLQSQVASHWRFSTAVSLLAGLLYLWSLPTWMRTILPKSPQRGLYVEEVEVSPNRNEEYPRKKIKREVVVTDIEAKPRRSILETPLVGGPSSRRGLNVAALGLNTILVIWSLDQNLSSKLFLKCSNLSYARVSDLSSNSASLTLRLPISNATTAHLAYRPQLAANRLSEESPVPWESSLPTRVLEEDDWMGSVMLEGLHPSLAYEYQIRGTLAKDSTTQTNNFTTYPDPRLSRGKFKFIHAGAPRYHKLPQNPFFALPSLLPLSYPITTPSPSHIYHKWKSNHLRQPAWRQLANWLADLRERTAWTQVEFALIGSGLEAVGRKYKPMSLRTSSEQRRVRQIMASQDVRDVYENLPVLASTPRSPSQGPVSEPGSVSVDSTTFQYGSASFYRLRGPFQEMNQADSVDWLNDVKDLKQWLARGAESQNFRFITTPISLAPWFGGRRHEIAWREAVLSAIASFPNVIVLAESNHGFTATLLRSTILEVASPPLTSPLHFGLWPKKIILDNRDTKRTQSESRDIEGTVTLVKYKASSGKSQWSSIEVDSASNPPRVLISSIEDGKTSYKLEYVSANPETSSTALGSLAQSLSGAVIVEAGAQGQSSVDLAYALCQMILHR